MKALEKDRSRRYETAAALSRELERYLNGEAVEACPPSAVYRVKKFVGKHRGKVLAAVTILLALVTGGIGTTVGFVRANRAKSQAETSEIRARASERQALDALDMARTERDEKEKQRKLAEQAEKEILESYRESTDDVMRCCRFRGQSNSLFWRSQRGVLDVQEVSCQVSFISGSARGQEGSGEVAYAAYVHG